ncbi:MAG: hypothetical protein P8Z37_14310 [Acidobacteriota bacterium]
MAGELNLTMEPGALPAKNQVCLDEKSMISAAMPYIDWNMQVFPDQ